MTVTPEMARHWLRIPRRLIGDRVVIAIDGRWEYSGDAIRFDDEGNLIDGEHRLQTCVDAGVPLVTEVVTGLAPDAIRAIDVTASLAERVMGWSVAPDGYLVGNRSWIPRWCFQPLERLEDALRLLEQAQPEYYSMGAGADGVFSVQVRIRGCGGEARHESKPRAITLAIARAVIEVDQ
jgi:hypothetical protein